MMQRSIGGAVVALVAVAALSGLAVSTGCTTAEAKPLEVTYYYLPG